MNFVRKRHLRGVAICVAVASLTLGAMPASAKSEDATRCNDLAASSYDPATPTGRGVAFNLIDADAAIAACTSALDAAPDDARLRFHLGRALDKAGRADEAIAAFEAAAAGGSLLALSSLGAIYGNGYGVPTDAARAVDYYRRAADAGLPLAQANLGAMYEHGTGVLQDYVKAAELYGQGADAGLGYAAASLGYLYESGKGVEKDIVEAVRLYRIGADAGEDFALRNMGVMYANGLGGLPKDDNEAFRYYQLAADANYPPAYIDVARALSHGVGTEADSDKARIYLNLAIAEGDPQVRGDGQNDLAWLNATENTSLDEAEALSREAVAAAPDNAGRLDTLGWILHLQGRDTEALPLIEQALKLEPDNVVFTAHLAAIRG